MNKTFNGRPVFQTSSQSSGYRNVYRVRKRFNAATPPGKAGLTSTPIVNQLIDVVGATGSNWGSSYQELLAGIAGVDCGLGVKMSC